MPVKEVGCQVGLLGHWGEVVLTLVCDGLLGFSGSLILHGFLYVDGSLFCAGFLAFPGSLRLNGLLPAYGSPMPHGFLLQDGSHHLLSGINLPF